MIENNNPLIARLISLGGKPGSKCVPERWYNENYEIDYYWIFKEEDHELIKEVRGIARSLKKEGYTVKTKCTYSVTFSKYHFSIEGNKPIPGAD
jgi:hypothetical protein